MSSINTLKDLHIHHLQDLYSANKQSKGMTQKLANAATDPELRSALESGVEGIQEGMDHITRLIEAHGAKPSGEHCKGMEGLVKEAQAHGLDADYGDDDVQDAMIIAQYQRMVHYALAGYGTAQAFAKRLNLSDDIATLGKCLDDTYSGDRHMTDIATGSSGVNAMAAE